LPISSYTFQTNLVNSQRPHAIRPPQADRPTHYNLFEIAFLPTGLIVVGVFLLLAAGGASAGQTRDTPPYR
jgi:hypothetical protein